MPESEVGEPGIISKFNVVDQMDNPALFSPWGYFSKETGKSLSPFDMGNVPASVFAGHTPAPFGIAGDPNSTFAKAAQGLAGLAFQLALPPASLAKAALDIYGLASVVSDLPSLDPTLNALSILGDAGEGLMSELGLNEVELSSFVGDDIAAEIHSAEEGISSLYGNIIGFPGQLARDIGLTAPEVDLGEAIGETVGEGFSAVGDALGLSSIGDTISSFGQQAYDALPQLISKKDVDAVTDALSLPNIDLSLGNLGDVFSGTPSLATVGQQGGGPGIPQGFQPGPEYVPPKPYVNPYFKDYPEGEPYKKKGPITMEELRDRYVGSLDDIQKYPEGYSMEDIREKYFAKPETNYPVLAHSGGGIQNLIDDQKKNYSIGNQDTINTAGTAFSRKPFSATPHEDLTNGSHSYVSNVLNGHAVPAGMTNVQQMQKPMEAFPTGGQMNYDHNLQADYSRPQSFYSMPNMNKVA